MLSWLFSRTKKRVRLFDITTNKFLCKKTAIKRNTDWYVWYLESERKLLSSHIVEGTQTRWEVQ